MYTFFFSFFYNYITGDGGCKKSKPNVLNACMLNIENDCSYINVLLEKAVKECDMESKLDLELIGLDFCQWVRRGVWPGL